LTLTYNGSDTKIWKVTDWVSTPREVVFGYDGSDRLSTVTDRAGKTTTYQYDGSTTRLTKIIDANAHTAVENHYDSNGRVDWQKDARGQQTDFSYDTYYAKTTQTLPASSFGNGSGGTYRPTIEHSFDPIGLTIKIVSKPTSSESLTTHFTHTSKWQVALSTDPRGKLTNFCYDTAGNLTRRVDPGASASDRLVTHFEYTGNDLTKVVAPKGVSFSNNNDKTNCGVSPTLDSAGLYTTFLAYDSSHNLTSTERRYTEPEAPSTVLSATTKFEYTDGANPGMVTRVIPPRGNTSSTPDYAYATLFDYYTSSSSASQAGMLERVTAPATTWNSAGDMTDFAYDAVGRRTSMIDPLGKLSGATASDHTWAYEYDAEDRLITVKTPSPVAPTSDSTRLITRFCYDSVGNRTHVLDANTQVTQYLYDERDGLEFVKQSPSPWSATSCGSIPSAPSDTITTRYAYDNLGFLTQVVRAHGDSTYARGVDYLYDGLGRLRRELQYPNWTSTSGALTTDYEYDGNGNLTLLREPNSQPSGGVTYAYDDLNRLTGINYSSSGTPDVTYTYDEHGNRLTMVSGTPDTTYTYDALDRLLSVAISGGDTVGYRYDRDGNRRRVIYPGSTGNVDYTFEKDGKLASLTDWASRTTSYSYFADGSVKDATNPNATRAAFSYDNALRLTEVHNQTTGGTPSTITRHKYTLDSVGNRTRMDEVLADIGTPTGGLITPGAQPNSFAPSALQSRMIRYNVANDATAIPSFTATIKQGSTTIRTLSATTAGSSFAVWDGKNDSGDIQPPGSYTAEISGQANQTITLTRQASHLYTYDRLYRLTREDNAFGPRTYAYDPLGNRLSVNSEIARTNYTYDKLDRLTQVGSTTYTNDNNGNRTGRGSDIFAYDQANRLIQFDPAATSATDYAYDGDGKRLCKSSTCSSPEFTYDVNRGLPVLVKDSTRLYVWGLGLAYAVDGTSIEVHHADGLGSVRALTNGSASVSTSYLTDAFGVSRLSRGTTQRMQYTGEPRDAESGFMYLRARTYDPAVGRFLQRDPYRGSIRSPFSLNGFAYVGQNPVSFVDPSGFALTQQILNDQTAATDCLMEADASHAGLLVNSGCMIHNSVVLVPVSTGAGRPTLLVPVNLPAKPPGMGGSESGEPQSAPVPSASNYRRLWFKAHPDASPNLIVHHSLPQKFEALLEGINIHENKYLRGVDKATHLKINKAWIEWEKGLGHLPTAQEIMDHAAKIDIDYGAHMVR
jgi:RHS repeat-associated protein